MKINKKLLCMLFSSTFIFQNMTSGLRRNTYVQNDSDLELVKSHLRKHKGKYFGAVVALAAVAAVYGLTRNKTKSPFSSDEVKELPVSKLQDSKINLSKNINENNVHQINGDCFLAALSRLMYNPHSADEGIYKKYSSCENLADISSNLPADLKNYIGNYDVTSPYYKNVLGLLNDEDKSKNAYEERLYLASIANRASFFQKCADNLKNSDLGFTDPIHQASYLNSKIPHGLNAININTTNIDYLSKQISWLPKEQTLNEQLFTGVCYALQVEHLRGAGDGDACAVLANILQHGPYQYSQGALCSDSVLEPSAVYMTFQGNKLDDNKQSKYGEQRGEWSELLSNHSKLKNAQGKWDDKHDFEKLNPNGTIKFTNKDGSEYVLVGVLVATGGHCTDNNLKFKTDSNGNLEFAGWVHHECLGQTPAVLNLIKKDSGTGKPKLTVQDFLSRYSSQVRNAARGGLILKFVPKTEVESHLNYYGCQNNNEGKN